MSFSVKGGIRLTVTGLTDIMAANVAIANEFNPTKMRIYREIAPFFVFKAKEKVHKISGDLARSIEVESITPERAVVSAGRGLKYARKEEDREGNRRISPFDTHPYMKPAAQQTGPRMGPVVKKHIDELLARHRTR